MDKEDLFKYREFCWDYFSLHADQRLKTFNFYLVSSAIFIGAFINILGDDNKFALAFILPYLLTILSFVFWKLDVRTRIMIQSSEQAIKEIDDQLLPDKNATNEPLVLNIFRYDDYQGLKKKNFWNRHHSYSKSFNSVFFVFGTIGFLAGTIYLFNL